MKRGPLTPTQKAMRAAKRAWPGSTGSFTVRQQRNTFVNAYIAGWNARCKIIEKQLPGETYREWVTRQSQQPSAINSGETK